jgi:hypothetical protein
VGAEERTMTVYVLQHVHPGEPTQEATKLIGVFRSEEAVHAAVARLLPMPGFREHPLGFTIEAHELDEAQWSGGFAAPAPDGPAPELESHALLEERFHALGAPDPEEWAASQLAEGIPQLHRFLFLRQAWRSVYAEDEPGWIAGLIAQAERAPDAPYAGAGAALLALRALGAPDDALVDLVRGVQGELLFQLCYLLEDPGIAEDEAAHVAWGLFTLHEDGSAGEPIRGLHESVLELDPTGREMRPR